MGAPTNAANVKKVLANSEPSTHGGKADIAVTCGLAPVSECMRRLAKQLELSG